MKEYFNSLNWKQIGIHLIATLLLIIGLRQLSFLTDVELVNRIAREEDVKRLDAIGLRLDSLFLWMAIFGLGGLLISNLIMYQLAGKQKHYWLNLISVLVLAFFLTRFDVLSLRDLVTGPLFFVGGLVSVVGPAYVLLVNGMFMIGLALLVFYNRRVRSILQRSKSLT